MPAGLHRIYGGRDFHFISCSCYQRRPLLKSAQERNTFLEILEQVRKKYDFRISGYVVMPEHFHVLMSEPRQVAPSTVMQVLKQRVARRLLPNRRGDSNRRCSPEDGGRRRFWQSRFYDFNVWNKKKHIEKLRYMHRNPVTRGLVSRPEDWEWSSFRFYLEGRAGSVQVDP
jgi:putative transposase